MSKPAAIPPAPRPGDAGLRPVDAGWRQWIAENRLRQCTPTSMLDTMVKAGLDPAACEHAIQAMESDPAYLAALKFQQVHAKLVSVVANQQRLRELDPLYGHVEKRSRVSLNEFVDKYVVGSRPVVLTDVAHDWPAMTRWSPEDLRARFGHLEVEVQTERSADPNYEVNKLDHQRKTRLADFVDRVLAGGATNDYYLTANNEMLSRPGFAPLLDDIGSLPPICDRSQLARRASFWFGPAGTVTPLHHDTIMLCHTQIVGRKRWRLISPLQTPLLYNHFEVYSPVDMDRPDLDRYPLYAQATVLDVVVEPGETMFLPLGWWHQVSSLDVSLSFSYSNIAVPNEYRFDNPRITNW
ncbi:MAG: cupin-like domain-containing protein [Hydrogenophaga sp.]|uniref:cupin-like domain-containing protein n=1 Tax=Hydrogenophaga sp. TaxID=1904254 RepID=UPI001D9FF3CF|nr:cupin-like domain-containing protein [Hydrogenophaga sp.]MBX3609532.1 cupin-like domain-containing protein [Hydrogenophaga sp.]